MHTRVVAQVEAFDCRSGEVAGRRLTEQSEHAAVVVDIGVEIEQRVAGAPGEIAEERRRTALTDVDHALEHPASLSRKSGDTAYRIAVRSGRLCNVLAILESPAEWAVILIVVVVLFGGSQLPKLARNLGQAQKEFKKGLQEGMGKAESSKTETETKSDDK